jgi:hypothetical protein
MVSLFVSSAIFFGLSFLLGAAGFTGTVATSGRQAPDTGFLWAAMAAGVLSTVLYYGGWIMAIVIVIRLLIRLSTRSESGPPERRRARAAR